MSAEASELKRIWSVQWASLFLFIVGLIAVIKAQVPSWLGFIPGAVGAVCALLAFGQRRHTLGVVVALLSLFVFAPLFNELRSFPTHVAVVSDGNPVHVGDTVPNSDLVPIGRN